MKVCVVGLGKLGACLAAALAAAGHEVVGCDQSTVAVAAVASNKPRAEPGLNDLLAPLVGTPRLQLTATLDAAVKQSEMTFVVVPTPSTPYGSFDASAVHDVTRQVSTATVGEHTLVIVSTVSPGTTSRIASFFESERFSIVYAPTFVALGSVLDGLRRPDFRLVGATPQSGVTWKVSGVLSSLGPAPLVECSREEAEIAKLAVNSFLTLKAAFANTVAMGCQTIRGVDARNVLRAVAHDTRIGSAFLKPGSPPGGPCLPRDGRALEHWLKQTRTDIALAAAIQKATARQVENVVAWCDYHATLGVLGVSYKRGVSLTEGSLGSLVVEDRWRRNRSVIVHDPLAETRLAVSLDDLLDTADGLLVATDHDEYRDLDTRGLPTLDMFGIVKPASNVAVWGRG